jgi:hypothetical protein
MSQTTIYYTVAVQAFYDGSGSVSIKEIALVHVESNHLVQHLIIKPPLACFDSLPEKFQKTNHWLINFFHGIPWRSGFADPIDIHLPKGLLFVKGRQLQKLLQNMCTDATIVDIEALGCDTKIEDLLSTRNSCCNWHTFNTKRCASVAAHALAQWVRENVR